MWWLLITYTVAHLCRLVSLDRGKLQPRCPDTTCGVHGFMRAAVIIMDTTAIFTVDMGFYIRILAYGPYPSPCMGSMSFGSTGNIDRSLHVRSLLRDSRSSAQVVLMFVLEVCTPHINSREGA